MPGPGRPFQPGKSGNPTGRAKVDPDEAQALRAVTAHAVRQLIEIANDPNHRRQFDAITVILDRTLGKPTQALDLDLK
jgi:hypothetical protein